MARYWIAVASKKHVQKGVLEGFAQVCHGKKGPLFSMNMIGLFTTHQQSVLVERILVKHLQQLAVLLQEPPIPFR
ncbi:MAG: hypothetical protein Tsb0021_01550 [Chlamydiales bacterium]